MPKYYQCKRSPSHYLSCPDGKVLRQGFQCVFPFGGGSKQCGAGLHPPVGVLPFGADKSRTLPLEDRYTKPDPSVPSPHPVPFPGGGGLSFGVSTTRSSPFGSGPPSTLPTLPSIQYHYHCENGSQRHRWVATSPLDRPGEILCPGQVLFGTSCDKPLAYVPGGGSFGTWSPLDASCLRRRSTIPTPVFTSFTSSSSDLDLFSVSPVRAEARSQSELTKVLMDSQQVSFLCRGGTFREDPLARSSARAANEYVEEPGLCALGPLTFLRMGSPAIVVGRGEVTELQQPGGTLQDELALDVVRKVSRGTPRDWDERRFLRDKLQAMRIFGCDDYIPKILREMDALARLVLERDV